MIKHTESGADVSILVDNEGNLVLLCEDERKMWVGKLTPRAWPATVRSMAAFRSEEAFAAFPVLAAHAPSVLKDVGFDKRAIGELLK